MKQRRAVLVGEVALRQLYEEELAAALTAIQRDDGEALHDFRVALRRLYTLVKQLAHADKQRQRVLRLIKAQLTESNRGRDAQVMLNWLQAEWPRLNEEEAIGARHWQRKLERMQAAGDFVPKRAVFALKRGAPYLDKLALHQSGQQRPLGLLATYVLEQQVSELVSLMKQAGTDGLHLIRLKAKTVRYLLLPFCGEGAACANALQGLQQLQTQLGEWHDEVVRQQNLNNLLRKEMTTISCDVQGFMAEGMSERSRRLPGLLALARSSHNAQQQRVALIKRQYLHDGGAALANLLHQAISEMRKAAATARS